MKNKIVKMIALILGSTFLMAGLTACEDNTVMKFVIDNQPYEEQAALEQAASPAEFAAQTPLYASIYFIESPKGMKYTAKWFLNDQEIKSEEKEMLTDKHGIIVYSLEADKVMPGSLMFQVLYRDKVVTEQSFTIK